MNKSTNINNFNNLNNESFEWKLVQTEMKTKLGLDIYESWLKKITFINPDVPTTEFTYDFHIDKLSSDKFEVYKVESLVKDIDWYATYYAKYHSDIKDIYKKKTVSKENEKFSDDWMSRQPLGEEMKKILEKVKYDPSAPEIESFKDIIDQHGYLHGYYLKAV